MKIVKSKLKADPLPGWGEGSLKPSSAGALTPLIALCSQNCIALYHFLFFLSILWPFDLCLQTNEVGGLNKRGGRDKEDQKESKDMTKKGFKPPSVPTRVAQVKKGPVVSSCPCHDGYQTSAFVKAPGQKKGEGYQKSGEAKPLRGSKRGGNRISFLALDLFLSFFLLGQ